jgi:hypothetical protein
MVFDDPSGGLATGGHSKADDTVFGFDFDN